MSDSEKLDLLLTEMQELKIDINQKFDEIGKKLNQLETGQTELKNKMEGLAVEQVKTQKELYKINQKIENTYGVTLDALAEAAENRK
ncbi:MAG: hypothetical protein HFH85_05335 [Lachnospiraceae bacterium]|nr:hypothetical protein [Lachnospiraceae bacterium]